MPIKIITSWRTLFAYAHMLGQARIAYRKNPCKATRKALVKARLKHDFYRDICLTADEMIGISLNDLSVSRV